MRAVAQVNRRYGPGYDSQTLSGSPTDTVDQPPAETPAQSSPEQIQDRAEQLVDAANTRGDLQLSAEDRKAIVDQVVAVLGPMIGQLSDEDVNRVVDSLIERMAELGAFSPPPPGPAASAGAVPSPEVAAEAAAEVAATQQPPGKLTWAERHFPNG